VTEKANRAPRFGAACFHDRDVDAKTRKTARRNRPPWARRVARGRFVRNSLKTIKSSHPYPAQKTDLTLPQDFSAETRKPKYDQHFTRKSWRKLTE
jgi:hypothetical protein